MTTNKIYFEENISSFKMGAVVKVKSVSAVNGDLIGHVTGFAMNSTKEVIVSVALCVGRVEHFHPSILEIM